MHIFLISFLSSPSDFYPGVYLHMNDDLMNAEHTCDVEYREPLLFIGSIVPYMK
jgi:hypothetical protein